jgi:hypothetical protein
MRRAPEKTEHDPRTLVVLVGAVVSLFAFVLYVRTLAPTVLYYELPDLRDAAVLQAKAAVLGVPDYTGYPTWVMLTHLLTYLPFGDVAYRANLASAVYAALAVFFVYMIGARLSGKRLPAAAGAVAFGVSPIFWSQALIAEVYTLNALLASATLFVWLLWRETRKDRYLLLAALLTGIALTHHLTSGVLLIAGFAFVLLVDRRKLLDLRLMLKAAGLFVLGLVPYAFLPIRASMDYLPPGWVWGQPLIQQYPPNTLFGFYNLVSGGVWKGRMFVFGLEDLPARFGMYLHYLYGEAGQFHVVLIVIAQAGAFYLLYKDQAGAVLLGIPFLGWLFHALEYNIEDIYYYFIPTYLILGAFMAVGFGALLEAAQELARRVPRAPVRAVPVLLAALVLVAPLVGLRETYREVDRGDDYRGRYILETVAEKAEQDATVLHHRSPLYYMILVEKRREDITLINYIEDKEVPGRDRAHEALEDGPVYILLPGKEDTPYFYGVESSKRRYQKEGYELVEVDRKALLYEIVRREGADRARQASAAGPKP